jgi:hypothetical protein
MEDFTNMSMMSKALRCAFFAGFMQVETLVLRGSFGHGNIDGKCLTEAIASLPKLRALEIRREWCFRDKDWHITGGTIMCSRDIKLRLSQPSHCLLQFIVTSSLSRHIHHLSLEFSYLGSGGAHQEMLRSLQQLPEKIGP